MCSATLRTTPITEKTFERQKWFKHLVEEQTFIKFEDDVPDDKPYFFLLPLPKNRKDQYAAFLVSNQSNDTEALLSLNIPPGQYFVELLGSDGLGFCSSEEELEVLYRALTGDEIED